MTETKPWKSYQDQLQILQDRGLEFDNPGAALNYLDRIGYYRLSGYWYPFRQLELLDDGEGNISYHRHNEFLADSHFEDAVKLYVFDKKLRLLALDALERIELAVRVDIAHLLGKRDIHAHESPDCLHGHFAKQRINRGRDAGKTRHELWLERYRHMLHRARREPFVEHYQKKYGRLPVWVAIEIWDFGLMSKLYAGLKQQDQITIAQKYRAVDGQDFSSRLRSLNFIRNVSAHHSRLWNINVLERTPVPDIEGDWQQLNNARPFYYFCIMQQFMQDICPNSSWSTRFAGLLTEFPDVRNNAVSLKDFGLLDNWQDWNLWSQK